MRTGRSLRLSLKVAQIRHFRPLARLMLVPEACSIALREDNMRRSDLYVGAATFVAIALAMPLAALEPIATTPAKAEAAKIAGACDAKLAALCDRAA
jgi:hypothetical protein